MPLKEGKKSIGSNVSELLATGRPKKQALAIALKKAGLKKANKLDKVDAPDAPPSFQDVDKDQM